MSILGAPHQHHRYVYSRVYGKLTGVCIVVTVYYTKTHVT